MSYSDEIEALEDERFSADMEQAELEAAGRQFSRQLRRFRALLAAGKKDEAARACPHGGGYPLSSLAAGYEHDPRAGQDGVRCSDCHSVLSNFRWDGPMVVLFACESFVGV